MCICVHSAPVYIVQMYRCTWLQTHDNRSNLVKTKELIARSTEKIGFNSENKMWHSYIRQKVVKLIAFDISLSVWVMVPLFFHLSKSDYRRLMDCTLSGISAPQTRLFVLTCAK